MASPSSGDDYYASLGNEPTQTGGSSEKKKIIKIVAKKAVNHLEPTATKIETPAATKDTTPIANTFDLQESVHSAEPTPEAQPYVSRTVKLPESGTLDLGGKFSAGPAVVFHTHNALPKPLGSNKMRSNAPLTRGQGSSNSATRSPFRPVGSGGGTPGAGSGNRPQGGGGFSASRPGQGGGTSKPNFRKPDAPKKNFKTAKR